MSLIKICVKCKTTFSTKVNSSTCDCCSNILSPPIRVKIDESLNEASSAEENTLCPGSERHPAILEPKRPANNLIDRLKAITDNRQKRETICWNCHSSVKEERDGKCSECHWIPCQFCGACKYEYDDELHRKFSICEEGQLRMMAMVPTKPRYDEDDIPL